MFFFISKNENFLKFSKIVYVEGSITFFLISKNEKFLKFPQKFLQFGTFSQNSLNYFFRFFRRKKNYNQI